MRGGAVVSGASEIAEAASAMAGVALGSVVVSGDGSVGCAEVADFGCHFLRSGAGALVLWADAGGAAMVGWGWVAGSLGRLLGGISGVEGGAGFCSDEGVAGLGCHFLRSGAAGVDEVSTVAGCLGVG